MDNKPGSEEARNKGCICPILDNSNGAGFLGNGEEYGWVTRCDCPIHGEE